MRAPNQSSPLPNKPYQIYLEDCVAGMENRLDDNSVDLCVTSIPFGSLFQYSSKPEDIGNNADGVDMRAGQFGLHMRFFIEQLRRVLKPGRNACIHIQQLRATVEQHGFMGRRDFRGALIEMGYSGGFEYAGEAVIPKNPQALAHRLSLHSLQFQTAKTNSTKLAPAPNDYVLVFHKPGDCEVPVKCLYDREVNPQGWVTTEEWIEWASGIWSDVQESDVIATPACAKEETSERHICPLQLEVIRRFIALYSNPGELVLDPFMGISSTAFVALTGKTRGKRRLRDARRAVGFELKESYHALALRNLEKLEAELEEEKRDLFSPVESRVARAEQDAEEYCAVVEANRQ